MAGINEFQRVLDEYTRSDEYLSLSNEDREDTMRGFVEAYAEMNPGNNRSDLQSVASSRRKEILRITGEGRRTYDPEQIIPTLAQILPDNYESLTDGDKIKALEAAKKSTNQLAGDVDWLNAKDLAFQMDSYLDAFEREIRGKDTGVVADKFYRMADGLVTGFVSPFSAEVSREITADLFPENPAYDDSFIGKLAAGTGDFASQMITFAIASAFTSPLGGTIAISATNASRRFQENYNQAINLGLSSEDAVSAGIQGMPGAAVDVLGDRFLIGKFLPKGALQKFRGEWRSATTEAAKKQVLSKYMNQSLALGTFRGGLSGSIAEGLSEAAGDYVAGYGGYAATGKDQFLPTPEQLRDSFAIGAILGGATGIAGGAAESGRLRGVATTFSEGLGNLSSANQTKVLRLLDQGNVEGALTLIAKEAQNAQRQQTETEFEGSAEVQAERTKSGTQDQPPAGGISPDAQVDDGSRERPPLTSQDREIEQLFRRHVQSRTTGEDSEATNQLAERPELAGRNRAYGQIDALPNKNITPEQRQEIKDRLDAMALSAQQAGTESIQAFFERLGSADFVSAFNDDSLLKSENFTIRISPGSETRTAGDLSTLDHEIFHLLDLTGFIRSHLGDQQYQLLLNRAGGSLDVPLTRDQREGLADQYEAWLKDGQAPENLKPLFSRIKDLMLRIYQNGKRFFFGGDTIPPEVNAVFQNLYKVDLTDAAIEQAIQQNQINQPNLEAETLLEPEDLQSDFEQLVAESEEIRNLSPPVQPAEGLSPVVTPLQPTGTAEPFDVRRTQLSPGERAATDTEAQISPEEAAVRQQGRVPTNQLVTEGEAERGAFPTEASETTIANLKQGDQGQIDIPEGFDQVKENSAGNLVPAPYANYTKDDAIEDIEEIAQKTIGLKVDKRIFDLLATRMYDSAVGETVVKEISQNSFDAIKAARENGVIDENSGTILISVFDYVDENNVGKQDLTIVDNGIGMTPEIVENAFFSLGGTNKETSKSSGGFGLAKMGIFMAAEKIKLETVRDGILTRTELTSEELKEGSFKIESIPVADAARANVSGTKIILTFPEEVEDDSGETKSLWIDKYASHYVWDGVTRFKENSYELDEIKLIEGREDDILSDVTVGTPDLEDMGFEKREVSNEEGTATFYWKRLGKKDKAGNTLYSERLGSEVNPDKDGRRFNNSSVVVLSNGLQQFSVENLKLDPKDWSSDILPYTIVMDVNASADPVSTDYPFNNSREAFRKESAMQKAMADLVLELTAKEKTDEFKAEFSAMEDAEGGNLTKDNPVFYNNTSADLTPKERKAMAEIARVFHDSINEVAMLAAEANDKGFYGGDNIINVIDKRNGKTYDLFSDKSEISENSKTIDYFYGIGLSKNWGGVQTNIEPRAILINPVYSNELFQGGSLEGADGTGITNDDFDQYAAYMYHIIFHEVNHIHHKNEGAGFTYGLAQLQPYLFANKAKEQAAIIQRIKEIAEKHAEVLKNVRKKFLASDVKDTDAELTGQSFTIPGDAERANNDLQRASEPSSDVGSSESNRARRRYDDREGLPSIYDTAVNTRGSKRSGEPLQQGDQGQIDIPEGFTPPVTATAEPTIDETTEPEAEAAEEVETSENQIESIKTRNRLVSRLKDFFRPGKATNSQDQQLAINYANLIKMIPVIQRFQLPGFYGSEAVPRILDAARNFLASRQGRELRHSDLDNELAATNGWVRDIETGYANALFEKHSPNIQAPFPDGYSRDSLQDVRSWLSSNGVHEEGLAKRGNDPAPIDEETFNIFQESLIALNAIAPNAESFWQLFQSINEDIDPLMQEIVDTVIYPLIEETYAKLERWGQDQSLIGTNINGRRATVIAEALANGQVPNIYKFAQEEFKNRMKQEAQDVSDLLQEGYLSPQLLRSAQEAFIRPDVMALQLGQAEAAKEFLQKFANDPMNAAMLISKNARLPLSEKFGKLYDEYRKSHNLNGHEWIDEQAKIGVASRLIQIEGFTSLGEGFRNRLLQELKNLETKLQHSEQTRDRELARIHQVELETFTALTQDLLPINEITIDNLANAVIPDAAYTTMTNQLAERLSFDNLGRGGDRVKFMNNRADLYAGTQPIMKFIHESFRGAFPDIYMYGATRAIDRNDPTYQDTEQLISNATEPAFPHPQQSAKSQVSDTKARRGLIRERHYYDPILERTDGVQIEAMLAEAATSPIRHAYNDLFNDEGFTKSIGGKTNVDVLKNALLMRFNSHLRSGENVGRWIRWANRMGAWAARSSLSSVSQLPAQAIAGPTHYLMAQPGGISNFFDGLQLIVNNIGVWHQFLKDRASTLAQRAAGANVEIDRRGYKAIAKTAFGRSWQQLEKVFDAVLFTPIRWGDHLATFPIFAAELMRIAKQRQPGIRPARVSLDTDFSPEDIANAISQTEKFVGPSGAESRAKFYTNTDTGQVVARNTLFAYTGHLSQLSVQLTTALSELNYFARRGFDTKEMIPKAREAVGIMSQIAAFTVAKQGARALMLSAFTLPLLKDLLDDDEEKLLDLQIKIDTETNPEEKAKLEMQYDYAVKIANNLKKLQKRNAFMDNLPRNIMRDAVTGVHPVLGFSDGLIPRALVFGAIDKAQSEAEQEMNETVLKEIRELRDRAKAAGDRRTAAYHQTQLDLSRNANYIPFFEKYPSEGGVPGLWGSVIENGLRPVKDISGAVVPALMGSETQTNVSWTTLYLDLAAFGLNQNDTTRFIRELNKAEKEYIKEDRDLQEKDIPRALEGRQGRVAPGSQLLNF